MIDNFKRIAKLLYYLYLLETFLKQKEVTKINWD